MEIEVSVQDFYWETGESALTAISPHSITNGQIQPETWENWFQKWLETLSPDIGQVPSCELSLRLTGDPEMQTLNTQYRQQNQPTDVLAFAALEVNCFYPQEMLASLPLYLGDIVISVDTAHRQAQQQGHPLKTELAWLAAHGFLHLLGWDHPDEDSLNSMLNQQEMLLQTIGLAVQT
ncbi:rRNA maturation RNase YbeY [Kamptonema sp. UHCC 0994]|uniref:rRNA maturation RNase YbeY n=1 Tax=Kamptonema sp. UHCC 0994 TaxID=3031329 RepID=UPI0023B97F5A|nr:rRNA maturation RNase YbeY [Kamptonema sp. UHCC 0994]MDF0555985.1 rRNA maturation RNase YbeY [Kamptonema sp. UHCC 0994]